MLPHMMANQYAVHWYFGQVAARAFAQEEGVKCEYFMEQITRLGSI